MTGYRILYMSLLVCHTEYMLSVRCLELELTSSLNNLKSRVKNLEHPNILIP